MNWFKKISQIWAVNEDSNILEEIYNIYKLEYQLSALKSYPFSGNPVRQDNIIKQLQSSLLSQLNIVRDKLLILFRSWLASHALLEPNKWADMRLGSMRNESLRTILDVIIGEYLRYSNINNTLRPDDPRLLGIVEQKIINEIASNLDDYPELDFYFEDIYDSERDYLRSELIEYGLDEFSEIYANTKFNSISEAEEWIDEKDDFDISDFLDKEALLNIIESSGNAEEVLSSMYANFVFPKWYEYWSEQGIDETRDNIEEVYNRLYKSDDIDDLISSVNIAINTMHQNGLILEYIPEYLSSEYEIEPNDPAFEIDDMSGFFSDLTNGQYNSSWDKELIDIGVEVPDMVKEDNIQRSQNE